MPWKEMQLENVGSASSLATRSTGMLIKVQHFNKTIHCSLLLIQVTRLTLLAFLGKVLATLNISSRIPKHLSCSRGHRQQPDEGDCCESPMDGECRMLLRDVTVICHNGSLLATRRDICFLTTCPSSSSELLFAEIKRRWPTLYVK